MRRNRDQPIRNRVTNMAPLLPSTMQQLFQPERYASYLRFQQQVEQSVPPKIAGNPQLTTTQHHLLQYQLANVECPPRVKHHENRGGLD